MRNTKQMMQAMANYLSGGRSLKGHAAYMKYLKENDLPEYLRQVEIRRQRRESHNKNDWDDLGDGGYHRKNHGLSEEEEPGTHQSVYERQVEWELSHGPRNEWVRGL